MNNINPNKTIEIYNYSDSSAKTEINFNDEIIFNQIDIEDIKILYKHGIIFIEGYIRHGDSINEENILKLNQWSREKGDSNKWLKRTNIKIVRNEFVVRDITFNAFIVDYSERFNKGKHRFTLILRQYQLTRLDGTRGDTGAVKTESYVKSERIKGVDGTLIITPLNYENVFFSGLNGVSAYSFLKEFSAIGTKTKTVAFYFIAHGTGVVTEAVADIKFTINGEPEKIGSFNLTRDYFYKPLGEIFSNYMNKKGLNINIDNNIGEDWYNLANLAFSWLNIGEKIIKGISSIKTGKGLNVIYTIKIKKVQASRFSQVLKPVKVIGLTPLESLKNIAKEILTEIYPNVVGTKNIINKKEDKE